MKSIFKSTFFILCFIMLLSFKTNVTFAEIVEQDNIKVKLQLENVENNLNEVKATVKVSNIGIRPIEEINMESIIPKGLKIKEGSKLNYKIIKLEAGKSYTYEFYCEKDGTVVTTPDNDSDRNEGTGVTTPDNNATGNEGTEGTIQDNSNGIDKPVINIETGDNSEVLIYLVIMIISLIGLILLYKMDKRNIKKIFSIFICITLLSNMFSNLILAYANEIENNTISTKEEIIVDNDTYIIEVIATYKLPESEIRPSGDLISRGEWVSKVVNMTNLKNEQVLDIDGFEYTFDDIEGHQYEEDIIFAQMYSILDVEEGLFNPDEPATREFVALTSVRALNLMVTEDIICDDSSEISYLKEVETAVSMQLINLENNKFYPLRPITSSEYEYVIEGINGILNSTEVEENYDNTFEYKEGVIKIEDDISYVVNNSTVTLELNNQTKNLKKDDIFVLPTQIPYKVTDIKFESSNVIVETIEPTLEETLDYIDIQGNTIIDINNFIPAEGVEIIKDNNDVTRDINIDQEGDMNEVGTLNLKISKKLGDDVKANGSASLSIHKISYKADVNVKWNKVSINNVFAKVNGTLKFDGGISTTIAENNNRGIAGFFKIGEVPIILFPGANIAIELGAFYSVDGSIELVYSLKGDLGVQVINNRVRGINTVKSDIELNTNYTAKFGPKVYGILEICGLWRLIDFSATGGGQANLSSTVHPGLVCFDVGAHLFLDMTLLDTCKIKDWLGITYNLSIIDKKNSPWKKYWHIEDGFVVTECTAGNNNGNDNIEENSSINGTVVKAGNRQQFIKDALIQVYDMSNNKLINETRSDSNGKYNITNLKAGNYSLKISKSGYITFESIEKLKPNETKTVETFLMVGQGHPGEEGIAGGKITDALTGKEISDISISIRSGWNNDIGTVIKNTTTNEEGMYEVKLPLGNYTVQMSKDGYITKMYNIYVASGSTLNQNNTLVPGNGEITSDNLRIVLTWGNRPYDLDSHLVGPTSDGLDYFHIYYNNKKYYEDGIKYADLDLDDTNSYGPETTTVYNMNSTGKYSFYVHDYTNRYNNTSAEMSNSGAKVEVYKGETLMETYNIPANNVGNYWHVFDYDAETNSIIPVNEFVDGIAYKDINANKLNISSWKNVGKNTK